jgi:hypothetical protein
VVGGSVWAADRLTRPRVPEGGTVTTIDLNPDAPHSPERTRRLADVAADAMRTLNYATLPHRGGLAYPGDAYDLLGALAQVAERLPQLCGQVGGFLDDAHSAGQLFETADGPWGGNARAAVDETISHLTFAADQASALRAALRDAQAEIRAVRYAGPDPDGGA